MAELFLAKPSDCRMNKLKDRETPREVSFFADINIMISSTWPESVTDTFEDITMNTKGTHFITYLKEFSDHDTYGCVRFAQVNMIHFVHNSKAKIDSDPYVDPTSYTRSARGTVRFKYSNWPYVSKEQEYGHK